jgi:hypothetical protein
MDAFPITSEPFTPVRELEKRNKGYLKQVEEKLKNAPDSLQKKPVKVI